MTVVCTQTTHQKETINLIKDFFSLVNNDISSADWGTNIISRLFGATGIKFDKPFMAEVFEGKFTTSSLLEKYPISASQVMYIFTILEQHFYHTKETLINVKATRVYHDGKIFTDGNINLLQSEKYFDYYHTNTYITLDNYASYRKYGIKTLVLVANIENVVEVENRIYVSEKENMLVYNIFYDDFRPNKVDYDYNAYKTHRIKLLKKKNDIYKVTLRTGTGKKHKYRNSNNFEPIDKSGYSVVAFRKSLNKRLEDYKKYSELMKVVKTDYSQELQTRYDEIMVLRNLIATSIINTTNSKTFRILYDLMGETLSDVQRHERIINKLKESREIYEKHKHELLNFCLSDYYSTVDVVTKDFEHLDRSIRYIKTKLFDHV